MQSRNQHRNENIESMCDKNHNKVIYLFFIVIYCLLPYQGSEILQLLSLGFLSSYL